MTTTLFDQDLGMRGVAKDKAQTLLSVYADEARFPTLTTPGAQNMRNIYLTLDLDNVSTAGSIFLASPVAGTITRIQSIIDGALAVADAGITTEINGVLVTGGAITITQAGSAAGDVDTTSPSALNTLALGDALEIITDGASTNAVKTTFTVTVLLT